jgi:hypothetical protein
MLSVRRGALAFGAAAIMGLLGPASIGNAKQPALQGGQLDDLGANRGICDQTSPRQHPNEAGNRAHWPGIRGMAAQMPLLRLIARFPLIALLALVVFLAASGSAGAAAEFSTLYNFPGGSVGGDPPAGLIFDASGGLYGMTQYGGACLACGTVFKLAPPTISGGAWTETVLHGFGPRPCCTISPAAPTAVNRKPA